MESIEMSTTINTSSTSLVNLSSFIILPFLKMDTNSLHMIKKQNFTPKSQILTTISRESGKFHPQYTNVKVDSLIPYESGQNFTIQ